MKGCLSDKALVLLHSGEGSEPDRAHLDACLSCARRYRQLSGDLEEIVAALKRPAPESIIGQRPAYSGLRWSWATAAIALAFVGGTITDLAVRNPSRAAVQTASARGSMAQTKAGKAPVASNDGGIDTPASFGLYVDELISQEDNDQEPMAAADGDSVDTDEL
ncbi:MAG TPA: hypothetical protein VEC38_00310 [Candidatus Binataceae bacterium]|nr:hypothetical protein [Candidatus Binataceae bacterium]